MAINTRVNDLALRHERRRVLPDEITSEPLTRVVELGIGHRTELAASLAADGVRVTATDIVDIEAPPDIRYVRDDLFDPTVSLYRDADLLYARRLPSELQGPARSLADSVECPLVFTTLGFEHPSIPVETISDERDTWYRTR